jgi:hypothetical protein
VRRCWHVPTKLWSSMSRSSMVLTSLRTFSTRTLRECAPYSSSSASPTAACQRHYRACPQEPIRIYPTRRVS